VMLLLMVNSLGKVRVTVAEGPRGAEFQVVGPKVLVRYLS
jgi:hypothetical protein